MKDKNNVQKIKDIKSLINEFYHDMFCRGKGSPCAKKCWDDYQKDCDNIEKELKKLEKLKRILISFLIIFKSYDEENFELLVEELKEALKDESEN